MADSTTISQYCYGTPHVADWSERNMREMGRDEMGRNGQRVGIAKGIEAKGQ